MRLFVGALSCLALTSGLALADPPGDRGRRGERGAPQTGAGGGNPDQVCQGDQKIEGRFNHNYFPGNGIQISEVCIKAGQGKFPYEAACGDTYTDGCYTLEWGENCESVTITGGGTGRDCKDISHTTAVFGDVVEPQFGNLTIRKVSAESSQGPAFPFLVSSDGAEVAEPALAIGESTTVGDLEPGTYLVTETGVPDWVLVEIACDGGNPQVDRSQNRVSVTLANSTLDVTCTFRNEQPK